MYGYGYSLYNQVPFGRGGIDPSAAAYFTATGITGATQQTAIDNLVKGLKADGLWSKMKAVYPFVTDNRNLLSYTNAFGNSYYITDGTSSFTANNTTAPDGTNTGTRFTAIASNNNYFYSANTAQGQSFGTGNKTYSIYVKAGTFSGNVSISITSDGTQQSTVATLTNDWQRINVSKNVAVAGNAAQYYIDLAGLSMTSGQFFYIWGAQFETSSTATTYQPIATTQQAFISSQFKYNLVNPVDSDAAFRLVFNGGWTHSSNGATPNGTNGYADTKFNANTNQSVNNFALSVYLRTANTNALVDMGAANSPTYLPLISIEGSAIGRTQYCWDFTTSKVDIATTDSKGMWGVSRTGATTWQSFQRNTAVAKTTTTSQTTLPNLNIYVGASSLNTGASAFSNREVSFAQLSNGLTNAEFNNLYTRVQAFQTSLSRQV